MNVESERVGFLKRVGTPLWLPERSYGITVVRLRTHSTFEWSAPKTSFPPVFFSLLVFLSYASDFATANPHSDLRAKTLNTRGAVYGKVVDKLDTIPPKIALPAVLPNHGQQRQRNLHVGGNWSEPLSAAWVATTSLSSPSPLKPIILS
jgi:hypothetical protein